ncbi:MAG: phage portal protein, lambda family [Firmicutes bacterium]|nr:phage portal protein, lambda family [Bacillota bacterium]
MRKKYRSKKATTFKNTGYSHHGASHTKKSLILWNDRSSNPDEDITWNLGTLRQRSRSLQQGNPTAVGALKTVVTNVVGPGLVLRPCIDAEALHMTEDQATAWETQVAREFALWSESKDCDAARMLNFNQLQQLVLLSTLLNGDCLVLLPMIPRLGMVYDLRVQLIEGDRLCNPDSVPDWDKYQAGIELDDYGAPVRYHIAKYYPQALQQASVNAWDTVEVFGTKTGRRNALLLMLMERVGQRRGVPFLAPVIEVFKQLGRYVDAELMAAVVAGCFTGVITTESGEVDLGEMSPPDEAVSQAGIDASGIKMGNGTLISLAPGEDIKSLNPTRPNTAFDGFVTSLLRQIGSALEIPMELLTKHFTASYSASRAALLEAWKMFKKQRSWLVSDFCQPVYEEWLMEAVARGRINAPGFLTDQAIRRAYCGAEWNGPAPGQINPKDEVEAAVMAVNANLNTLARATVELNGGDFNQNYRQRVREMQMLRKGDLLQQVAQNANDSQSNNSNNEGGGINEK